MTSPRIRSNSIVKSFSAREVERRLAEIEGNFDEDGKVWKEAVSQFTRSILELENNGWEQISRSGLEKDELTRAQDLAVKARKMTKENGLLKRGESFRGNNVFGKGAPIEGDVAPRFQSVIDNPLNQESIFSIEAQLQGDKTLFTDGNFYVLYNQADKMFEVIPLDQISDIWFNPERPSQIWYYKRKYSFTAVGASSGDRKNEKHEYWIPVDTYKPKGGKYETKIDNVEVRSNMRLVDFRVNRDTTDALGTPDCYPALPWAWAYAEGLRDGIKLNRALASIAWLVKQRSTKGTANVGAKIATNGRGAGQTAVATEGTELTSMPRANAIDLTTLRPVASMVASSLEMSTVAILSDSGAASGSNAAETTLDGPSRQAGESRQELWQAFYKRIFRVMGIPEGSLPMLNFPKIETTPAWRVQQGLTLAFTSGAISQKEYREGMAESMDMIIDSTLPTPNEWTGTKKNAWVDATDEEDSQDNLPSQGNSGAVGALDDGDNSARDNGEFE